MNRKHGRLSASFDAALRERRGRADMGTFDVRYYRGAGHQEVHERSILQLAALVVIQRLEHRHSDSLRDPAPHLPLDDLRIDHGPAVFNTEHPGHLNVSGLRIQLDHAAMATARIGFGRIIKAGGAQYGLDILLARTTESIE